VLLVVAKVELTQPMVRLLVVPVAAVAVAALHPTVVVQAPPAKGTQVATRLVLALCCFVQVVVAVAKQPQDLTLHLQLVAQVVVVSQYRLVGLIRQHCRQAGQLAPRNLQPVVVAVATSLVVQVDHRGPVEQVVSDPLAQQPQPHQSLVLVVAVVV
jgi:hypothetical protein